MANLTALGAPRNSAEPVSAALAIWILVSLMAAGAVLRFIRLEHQSFWYDEAVSASLAQAPLQDILSGRARDLGNPPFYVLLLAQWQGWFGLGDAAARALSALAGTASIAAVYAVARRVVRSEATALGTAAIFALSPVQVYFGQEARAFALVTLIGLLSMLLLLRAVEDARRVGTWIGFGVATFLALYTHYFALFLVLAQVLWLLATRRRQWRTLLSAAGVLSGAGLAFAFAWLQPLIAQLTTKGNLGRAADSWYLHLLSTPLVFGAGTTLVWKGLTTPVRLALGGLALVLLSGLAALGIRSLRRDREHLALVLLWLLTPLLVPLLISLTLFPFFYFRYALFATPAYYLLIAVGLRHLSGPLRTVAAVALLPPFALSLGTYYSTAVKHDWRGAVAWVAANVSGGDAICFDADIGETAFAHYGGPDDRRIRLLEPPDASPASRYTGTSQRREAAHPVFAQLAEAPRVWLVLSDPGSGTGAYYPDLFARDWLQVGERRFRGIEVRVLNLKPSDRGSGPSDPPAGVPLGPPP